MERGAWQVMVYEAAKSQTRLSNSHTHTHTHTHLIGWQGSKPFKDEDGGGESTKRSQLGGMPGPRARLKGLHHVLLGPESGAHGAQGTGANPLEEKVAGSLAGCVETENKGLGSPGLTLPYTAV